MTKILLMIKKEEEIIILVISLIDVLGMVKIELIKREIQRFFQDLIGLIVEQKLQELKTILDMIEKLRNNHS